MITIRSQLCECISNIQQQSIAVGWLSRIAVHRVARFGGLSLEIARIPMQVAHERTEARAVVATTKTTRVVIINLIDIIQLICLDC